MSETSETPLGEAALKQIREQAAHWDARVRSESCTAQERAEFNEWLRLRPEHAETFASLQQGIRTLQLAASNHPTLRALRDRAVAVRRQQRNKRWSVRAAAAAVLAVIGIATVQLRDRPLVERAHASVFQTAIGERSSVQLQDGSELTLDTGSRVEVEYSLRQRALEVSNGRAYFRVAKDASRPFVVSAAGRQIVAVGTEFDVRLEQRNLVVTLIEGRVDVRTVGVRAGDDAMVQVLAPGERLVVDRTSGLTTISRADVEKVTSWRQGKILFEDAPLDEAVEEMNRYSRARIVVDDDPALAQLRVSGMFYTAQPDNFVRALSEYFDIRAHVEHDGTTYLSREQASR